VSYLRAHRQAILKQLGPPLLFMLLSAAFLWEPLFTGRVFLPTDLIYKHDHVWRPAAGIGGAAVAQNDVLSDVSDYYYPFAYYAMQRLSAGEFPLWNPYILTGTPLFAAAQAAVLDPINLLTYLAGPLDYWVWGAFLRLALLGFGMYGFVRALGRSMAGSIASGAAFMTCGFVTVWLNYSVVTSLVWVPLMLWATTRMLQTGQLVWMAATGAAMGALLLGGHPETQFLSGLLWGLYGLYWVIAHRVRKVATNPKRTTDDRRRTTDDAYAPRNTLTHHISRFTFHPPNRLLLLAGSAILGIALAAVQILTFTQFLLSTSAFAIRSTPVVPFDLGQTALRFAVMFFPNFGGTPVQQNYWVLPFTNFNEQTGYIGLVTLGLALVGALAWLRRDRLVPFFVGFGLFALLMAIRVPGSDWVRSLPIFSIGHGVRWAIVWSICGAVLAAYGIDALLGRRTTDDGRQRVSKHSGASPPGPPQLQDLQPVVRRPSSVVRTTALGFGAIALIAFIVLLVIYMGIRDNYWDRAWGPVASHSVITRLFHPAQLTLYLPILFLAAGCIVLIAGWRRWLRAGSMATLLIILLYAELWATGSAYNPVTPAQAVFPSTTLTDYLSNNQGHERIAGLQNTLRPNAGMAFNLRDLRGYDDLIELSHGWLYGRFTNILRVDNETDLKLTRNLQRLLNTASVKYLLTLRKPRVDGDARPYEGVLQEDKVALYENLDVLPRAFVVFSSTVVPDDLQAAKDALLSPENDPRKSVVLSGAGAPLSGPALDLSSAPVTWLKDAPEDAQLVVDLPAPGYLVLNDNYAPGWEATVDGQPAPMIRANVTFRAVAVPQGRHTVRFEYRPPLLYAGAVISVLSAITIFAIALVHLLRRPPIA
jgi:hypothetical protein